MKISKDELIEDFYEKYKHKYKFFENDLENKAFIAYLCKVPFKFLRSIFLEGTFETIRFSRLGKFFVTKSTLEKYYKNLDIKFERGYISEELYKKHKENIKKQLENYVEEDD